MTFDQFITKWQGKGIDFDGVYPNQCMDLMHQYVYDVLGITDKATLAQPAAYQVFTNFSNVGGHDQFQLIANTPTGVPQKGDIVFFGQAVGAFGHVCIFIEGDVNSFTSFDANWPTGSLPHKQTHTYNGVLGWLHPKVQAPTSTVPVDSATFQQLVDKATKYDAFNQAGFTSPDAVKQKLADLTSQLSQANDKAGKYDGLQAGLKDLSSRFS